MRRVDISYPTSASGIIGHFRVHLSLHFKARVSAKSLLWKSVFIHIEIRTNYHNKKFALRLALKERLRGTRKWPMGYAHKNQIKYMATHVVVNETYKQTVNIS